MHTHELTGIAIVVGVAMLGGILMTRLKQPAIVGYILAGILLGPSGFALVEDRDAIALLAELGVLMLLFVIGMELSLRAFKRVWRIALLGALAQILLATATMALVSYFFDWPRGVVLLLGFSAALSSTAVSIKILEATDDLRTDVGRVAVGILIAQDLAVVPMLLAINMVGVDSQDIVTMAVTLAAAVAFLIGLVVVLSRRQSISLPFANLLADDVDLATMAGLTLCFVSAAVSGVFGISPAYGAFLAGLVVGNSRERPRMIAVMQPVQSVLLMVFFVSIGLLFDLGYVWLHFGTVMMLLLLITVAKTTANIGILRALGEPWQRSIKAGAVLGQVGEFSFVLMDTGVAVGLVAADGHRLAVSLIALSLVASPVWMVTARRLQAVAWRRISTFQQLWQAVYGRETRAVVAVSERAVSRTVKFTLGFGEQGSERFGRLRGPKPADDGDDDAIEGEIVPDELEALPGATPTRGRNESP